MRVLLLSPGGPETQLARLPLAAQIALELGAQLQVAQVRKERKYHEFLASGLCRLVLLAWVSNWEDNLYAIPSNSN